MGNYGIFAEWAYRYAEVLIEQKAVTGEIGESFIPPKVKKYDVKMRAALLLVVPEKVKNKSLRQDNATVVDMLVDLISRVNPAVKSELDSLKSFTANPGTANTAAEAEEKLVHWQSARKRLIQLGATDVATSEATSALNQIVKQVVSQHDGFHHRYSKLMHATSDIPTADQARKIENLIKRELADCAGKDPHMGMHGQWQH